MKLIKWIIAITICRGRTINKIYSMLKYNGFYSIVTLKVNIHGIYFCAYRKFEDGSDFGINPRYLTATVDIIKGVLKCDGFIPFKKYKYEI